MQGKAPLPHRMLRPSLTLKHTDPRGGLQLLVDPPVPPYGLSPQNTRDSLWGPCIPASPSWEPRVTQRAVLDLGGRVSGWGRAWPVTSQHRGRAGPPPVRCIPHLRKGSRTQSTYGS